MEFLETIKAKNGKLYNLSYHKKRSGIKDIELYLNPPRDGLYRCRLVYNSKDIKVSYHKYKKRVINSLKLVYDDSISYDKKSTNRSNIDKLFSLRGFCDDIIIVKNSLLTDTSIANIALCKDNVWYTPRRPLLKGTTRQRFLDNGLLKEADIKVSDIKNYEKLALLNAMINFDIIADKNIGKIIQC